MPKCFLAKAALTIATGCRTSRSSTVNVRPSSSFCPVAEKKLPVTCSKLAVVRSPRSRYSRPSISTGLFPENTILNRFVSATDSNSGSFPTCSNSRS